jgi:hypothetical protein
MEKKMKKAKITLNFIDGTRDTRQKKIVIFQKHGNPDFNRYLIAWKVITFSGVGGRSSYPYWDWLKLSISEADGIFTLKYPVQPGFLYDASKPYQRSGYVLSYKSLPSRTKKIQVINSADRGAIDLLLYRSGLLLFKWHHLLPAKTATFEIPPILYITVVIPGEEFKVEEGRVMSRAVLSLPCAQFSLEELKSADIVVVGSAPENWTIKLKNRKNQQEDRNSHS